MEEYKRNFLELAIKQDVLTFGEFTLKSGRKSPYFFNAGFFNTGQALADLGQYFANAIIESGIEFDMIFGPAYKGITLCSSICQSLYSKYSIISQYAFNRKETKLHGDKGNFVGCDIKGESLIVDDVISSGSSIIESYNLILESHATCKNILVAFNRMEIGKNSMASKELKENYDMQTHYLINLDDIYEYIKSNSKYTKYVQNMDVYISKYKGI